MTARKVYLEPISSLSMVYRPSMAPASKALISPPSAAAALLDGEWVVIDANGKLARSADITQAAGTVSTAPISYLWWEERGRIDVQAIEQGNVVLLGCMEFETLLFASALSGVEITAVGQPLKVAVITDSDGNKRSGLVGHQGSADTNAVVGRVTKLPASNGGKLRFHLDGRR